MPGQLQIACIGGESTGKTTLAHALAARVQGVVVAESLRAFVVEHGRPPIRDEQADVLNAQRVGELQCSTEHPQSVIFCDPATLMIAIYSQLYFGDDSLLPEALADAANYDALLWCRPDIPWVPDPGQHDGPHFRSRADALLAQWVGEHGAHHLVVEVTGLHDRVERADALLKARLGSVWQPEGTVQPT